MLLVIIKAFQMILLKEVDASINYHYLHHLIITICPLLSFGYLIKLLEKQNFKLYYICVTASSIIHWSCGARWLQRTQSSSCQSKPQSGSLRICILYRISAPCRRSWKKAAVSLFIINLYWERIKSWKVGLVAIVINKVWLY